MNLRPVSDLFDDSPLDGTGRDENHNMKQPVGAGPYEKWNAPGARYSYDTPAGMQGRGAGGDQPDYNEFSGRDPRLYKGWSIASDVLCFH